MLSSRKIVRVLLVNTPFSSRHRYACVQAICLLVTSLFCFFQPNAYAEKAPEYQLKATFLFHFLDFTKWPNHDSDDKTICILGRDPFNNYLHELARIVRSNQKIIIKQAASLNDTHDCHILFISRSEANNLNRILENLVSSPLLTVSDIDSFAANHGMIELARKSSKTQLIINLTAVKSAGIKLNSNLIDLAQVVGNDEKTGGSE